MGLITTLVSGLNPDVDKFKFVNKNPDIEYNIPMLENKDNQEDAYFIVNVNNYTMTDIIRNQIKSLFDSRDHETKISSAVLNNGYELLEVLSPSSLEELSIDNIYSTPYGTLIIDWEKDDDNVFSLELGAQKIGYFIEINGRDQKQIDGLDFRNSAYTEILTDLSTFLR